MISSKHVAFQSEIPTFCRLRKMDQEFKASLDGRSRLSQNEPAPLKNIDSAWAQPG
ncbi:mCG142576 [Mus musculus]|nr:mCG142576 [Mus musculus]